VNRNHDGMASFVARRARRERRAAFSISIVASAVVVSFQGEPAGATSSKCAPSDRLHSQHTVSVPAGAASPVGPPVSRQDPSVPSAAVTLTLRRLSDSEMHEASYARLSGFSEQPVSVYPTTVALHT
jgi:hypothetical protein